VIVSVPGGPLPGENRMGRARFDSSAKASQAVTTRQLSSQKDKASLVAQRYFRLDDFVTQMCDSFMGSIHVSLSNRLRNGRRCAEGRFMKLVFTIALILGSLAAAHRLCAQAPNQAGSGQSQPAAGAPSPSPAQQPAQAKPQTNANPFPEDTTSVPVMPTRIPSDVAPGDEEPSAHAPMPAEDGDPVRSPEEAADAADSSSSSSSSSLAGMGDLNPPDDETTQPGKHKKKGEEVVPEHHETAAEDEEVGSYYLENKNWKGALSRFQSALVLDPDNPDVYWGLAEAEHHLGDFADARDNYKKVMEYDPGSRHAKEAAKALEDPEIANAKAEAPTTPTPQQQQ